MYEWLELLFLLVAANGAPILLDDLMGRCFAWPLDTGLKLADGRRLLGQSATVRGLLVAVLVTAGLASLLGHGAGMGALIAALAMLGDALSSFVKRRLGLEPGAKAPGLDQIPESLLPLVAVRGAYGLGWGEITALVLAFMLFDVLVSRILFRLHLRKRPY